MANLASFEVRDGRSYVRIGDTAIAVPQVASRLIVNALEGWTPPKAPAVLKVSREIEEVAAYMVRDFHDWVFTQYHLEPGFQELVGQPTRNIKVHYQGLRDDWEDDFRRALDAWGDLGFTFDETDPELADIVVDDEKKGAYALRRFRFSGRKVNGLPTVQATGREINIWKEWPEQQMLDAMMHEIGHVLGLGHPGPYNGTRPPAPLLAGDNAKNTIMSYFGRSGGRLGAADRLAIDMLYG